MIGQATQGLPPSLTAIARTVADRYRGATTVFLSGSLVEGIGNDSSDVDVFVVHDYATADSGSTAGVDVTVADALVNIDYLDGFRVDTEHWVRDAVLGVADAIAGAAAEGELAAGRIAEHQLQLAHRVRVGLPVTGEREFAGIRAAFDWPALSRVLAQRFLSMYNDAAEDAAGAVRAGEAGTAMLASRRALGAVTDALLAITGSTNNKQKWRFAKLRQLGDGELARAYLAAEVDTGTADEALLDGARRRLRYAAELAHDVARRLATDPRR
jgi:hypothetical protein